MVGRRIRSSGLCQPGGCRVRNRTRRHHHGARRGAPRDAGQALGAGRGGDGQTPLHFASTVGIAEYLLDHGAEIDIRDIDHESTPAQYMVGKRPEVARYLVGRGCRTDILMAAALGDLDLIRRHLDADADSIRMRVGDEYFPMISPRSGGSIYQWELGWHVSAVQAARSFGHSECFEFLMERSPDDEKLLNACWLHDEATVRSLLARHPDLSAQLTPGGRRQLARAARNNDGSAAQLMLESRPACGHVHPTSRYAAALGRMAWQCGGGPADPAA